MKIILWAVVAVGLMCGTASSATAPKATHITTRTAAATATAAPRAQTGTQTEWKWHDSVLSMCVAIYLWLDEHGGSADPGTLRSTGAAANPGGGAITP